MRFVVQIALLVFLALFETEARSNVTPPPLQNGVYRSLENSVIAIDIYKKLASREKQSNIFFSPVSLAGALGMVEIGAKGKTRQEIVDVFDVGPETDKLRKKSSLGETYEFIAKISNKNVTVKTTNRVFVDDKVKVFEHYKNALKVYNADVQKVKFSTSPGQAVYEMNKFSAPTPIVDDGLIKRETAFVLSNSISFDGEWHSQFRPDQSELRPFYVTHHDYVNVEMMFQRGIFRYTHIDSLTLHVVELPFVGKELSMVIMMPENFDLPLVEQALTAENLDKWMAQMEYKTVEVVIPKFQLTMVNNMNKILSDLGISSLFDAADCDLSGVTNTGIHVDELVHTAQINVRPHGGRVEAERAEAHRTKVDDVLLVYTDHPFLMFLRSNPTPTSFTIAQLFAVGRYALPKGRIIYGRDEF